MRKLFRIALALAGLAGANAAHAQVTNGTIVGTVKDAQGAAVPGATVTISNQAQGTSGTYATDADGSFNAPFLIPGVYDVTIELAGFRKHVHRGVVLQVNQRARVDAALEIGGLTDSTEVIGLAP
ncbi:MAG: carboxypeptidase-like regulatory domain-containing protein, partial [Vicinamibacteria bacterium]